MLRTIYLIRHSGPFVDIENYEDYANVQWEDYNRNMILSVEGERKAEKLCEIEELKNINTIYSSNSFRAIATAKYLAENNNTKIKLDDRINERNFGCKYLNQLPNDYTKKSFDNKNYKFLDGESLNEMDLRLSNFIDELLKQNNEKTIVIIHGIMLLSFLSNICDYEFDGEKIFARYKGKLIVDTQPKSPGVYKIIYDNNEIIDVEIIN